MMATVYMLLAIVVLPNGEPKYVSQLISSEGRCKMALEVWKGQMQAMNPYWSNAACVPIKVKFPKNPEIKS